MKTHLFVPAALLCTLFSSIALTSCNTVSNHEATKPVILIAAFGSSYESGQANLNDFDQAVVKVFPGYEVQWAFTASFIVNKLRNEGTTEIFERKVSVQTIDEALDSLRKDGKKNIVLQCLHLMVGAEFRQTLEADTTGLNVKYSYPLLFDGENIPKVIQALEGSIINNEKTATVFCAHGNEKHPEYNAELVQIDNYLREHYTNSYLAVMEGNPEFSFVKEEIRSNGTENVQFVTFMLTYGDHMSNDVMGDEEDSMKTQLGLPAECTNGLASNPEIQKIFIANIQKALTQL